MKTKPTITIHIDDKTEVEVFEDYLIFYQESDDADFTGSHFPVKISKEDFKSLADFLLNRRM